MAPTPTPCERCGRLTRSAQRYSVGADATENGRVRVCLRCALGDGAMLRRSALVAAIVGTLLALLNQGDLILRPGPTPMNLYWKIPLTYLVPFCVATYGALANARE